MMNNDRLIDFSGIINLIQLEHLYFGLPVSQYVTAMLMHYHSTDLYFTVHLLVSKYLVH